MSETIPYVTPDRDSYRLLVPFYMPTEDGRVWSIALSDRSGLIFTTGVAMILTIIFSYAWITVAAGAVLFDGGKKLPRYAGLLAVWNAGDPWEACKVMCRYTYDCVRTDKNRIGRQRIINWGNFWFGCLTSVIALLVAAGNYAVSIYIPERIQIGNVAPVNPSVLYYPAAPQPNNNQMILEQFAIKVPAVMRALSSATISRDELLKDRVNITASAPQPAAQQGDQALSLDYSFSLTGVDFGLQHVPHLNLNIQGSCTTEYSWLGESTATNETYFLWNTPTNTLTVFSDETSIRSAPVGSFVLHPQGGTQASGSGNISYAVVVGSANRGSLNEGSDPWYATEPRPSDAPEAEHDAKFWVRRRRPVLSCWEQRTWKYKDVISTNFPALNRSTHPDLAAPLYSVLRNALGRPMIVTVGIHAGDSALLCRTTSSRGVVDANRCSIRNDMERLILASYVATQQIFTDSTLFRDVGGYPNVYNGQDAVLDPGADGFVLYTTNVQTFKMAYIITIATLLVVFFFGRLIAVRVVKWLGKDNIWNEMELLSASQLFRHLDPRQFSMQMCNDEQKKKKCNGHLDLSMAKEGNGDPAADRGEELLGKSQDVTTVRGVKSEELV
ncbi:hypothetical protein QBC42DRAFT_313490 [Cladorrhinum samala]|uniref:Uncharacterized protein n=1 Tax=Cladorrhinum samala TaxID=585594 RepID=A0AAV9HZ96_9PEZI|nr:hypothetical protein QBC42DRAFT_313490 [Cladorrhinum samala]